MLQTAAHHCAHYPNHQCPRRTTRLRNQTRLDYSYPADVADEPQAATTPRQLMVRHPTNACVGQASFHRYRLPGLIQAGSATQYQSVPAAPKPVPQAQQLESHIHAANAAPLPGGERLAPNRHHSGKTPDSVLTKNGATTQPLQTRAAEATTMGVAAKRIGVTANQQADLPAAGEYHSKNFL